MKKKTIEKEFSKGVIDRHRPYAKNFITMLKLLCVYDETFYNPIEKIRKDFNISRSSLIQGFERIDLYNKTNSVRDKAFKNGHDFWDKLSHEKQKAFTLEINNLVSTNHLGFEWAPYIMNIIISDFWDCPDINFYINSDKEKGYLKIELNSTTTEGDISSMWNLVKKEQIKVFGNIKKKNVSKKFGKQLSLYMKYKLLKSTKRRDLDTTTNKPYSLTDLDLVPEIFEDSEDISIRADKKRANLLSQLRRRLKAQ
jgi:hypothetical protein